MKRHALGSALLLALALCPAAARAAREDDVASLDRPDPRWRQGPVKHLLGKEEDAEYRKLKTEEERRGFIERFWSRRDPTPGTDANEFKEAFVRRLQIAEERFGPPDGRGWEEDRGKVLLLLGPPDTVEIRQSGAADPDAESAAAPRKRAVFTYEREVLPGAARPLVLEFMEDGTGGFRLLGRFDLGDPRLTGLDPLPIPAPPAPKAALAAPPPPPEPVAPPPPPPPTPQQQLMEEILGGPTPAVKIPVAARLDFYKTELRSTLATLTISVKRPAQGGAAPLVAARFTGPGDEAALTLDREESFKPAEENSGPGDELLFQAAHDLPPGKYSLVAAAKDPSTGDVGYVLQIVEVPDFRAEALQLSTVTLARKVERMTSAPSDQAGRFTLGGSRVVPSPQAVFRADQDLWLYYQVYNTANDPATGHPKLKIAYRFEKVESAGNRVLGGRPIEQTGNSNVQAYAITVQKAWPAGDYRVVVTVEDTIARATASAIVPFKVAK